MIFSELYSAYYNTVAKILTRLIEGGADERALRRIVEKNAFAESVLTVLPALREGRWQLMHEDLTTPIVHRPTMPLTDLQKRWLKAISLDPRIKLFGVELNGLEDVEPLFTEDDYVVYDKYGDGDDYTDEGYIERFRLILEVLKTKQPMEINALNRNGSVCFTRCMPIRLEYSEKDDKFRLITSGCRYMKTVNLGRIVSCSLCRGDFNIRETEERAETERVTLRITDERNALERCLLHFAHFEKQAEKQDEKHYLVHINYDRSDEMEIVIRVLSFGPMVEAVSPPSFREKIIEKLKKQKNCGL